MAKPDGFFELRTARQLLDKLEADLRRLQSSAPISKDAQYAAFDFFVTAEHIPEWVATVTGASLATLRRYADGLLVSHVANGAIGSTASSGWRPWNLHGIMGSALVNSTRFGTWF